MKTSLISRVIVAFLILSGCQHSATEKQKEELKNLLKNGDFENGLSPWKKSFWKPGGSMELDNIEKKDGKNSVRISNSSGKQYSLLLQQVPLKSNSRYRVSFYIKANGIERAKGREGGAALLILDNGKNLILTSPTGKSVYADGSFNWQKCELEFETKKLTGTAVLYLINCYAKGSVWFDDITLEEIKIPPVTARLFPVEFQKDTYNLATNFPTVLVLQIKGKPKKNENLVVTMDLPEGVECLGAQRWLNSETDKMKPEKIERNGKIYKRYTISANKAFLSLINPDRFNWAKELLYLRAVPGSPGGKAYWHITAGNYKSHEKEFKINVLPELKTGKNKLKDFGLITGHPYYALSRIPEVRRLCHKFWLGLAEKPYIFCGWYSWNSMDPEFRKQLDKDFRKYFLVAFDYPGWKSENPGEAKHIPLKVNESGKEAPSQVCPGYMAEYKDSPVWNSWIPGTVRRRMTAKKVKNPCGIVWDFEPCTNDYCFCAECRKDFAQFAKLKKIPDAKWINEHKTLWSDYQARQYSKILENFSGTVRKNFPGIPVVLCTDPLKLKSSGWCPVDIRLSDQGQFDLFMNMPYYSGIRFFDDTALNSKSLKTPNFPIIDPAEELISFFSQYSPEKVKMNIVATAALGCKGIGFWPGDGLDGKYLRKITDAVSLVAESEKYYSGKRADNILLFSPENALKREIKDGNETVTITEPDFSANLRNVVWEKDGNYLLVLFNYSKNNTLIAKAVLPKLDGKNYFVHELNNSSLYSSTNPGKGFLLEIPPESVKLIEITKDKPETSKAIAQSEIIKHLEECKKNFKNSIIDKFPPVNSKDAEISWGFLLPDRKPLLKLCKGEMSVYINLDERGSITSWRNEKSDYLIHDSNRGFLDKLILFNNAGPLSYRYELRKTRIEEGIPTVELFYRVPPEESANANSIVPEGVEITKIISLEENGKSIKTKYRIVNNNSEKKTLKISFRVSNFPRMGHTAKKTSLTEISRICYNDISIPAAGPATRLILGEGIGKYTLIPGEIMPLKWNFSPVKIAAGNMEMVFSAQKPDTAGFMTWNSQNYFTVEFLSSEIELKFNDNIEYQTSVRIK